MPVAPIRAVGKREAACYILKVTEGNRQQVEIAFFCMPSVKAVGAVIDRNAAPADLKRNCHACFGATGAGMVRTRPLGCCQWRVAATASRLRPCRRQAGGAPSRAHTGVLPACTSVSHQVSEGTFHSRHRAPRERASATSWMPRQYPGIERQ